MNADHSLDDRLASLGNHVEMLHTRSHVARCSEVCQTNITTLCSLLIVWPRVPWIRLVRVYTQVISNKISRPRYSFLGKAHLRAAKRHLLYGITHHYRHPTQVNAPRLINSHIGQYSIYLPRRYGRLSWARWLVTYWDGLPARKQSPIQVLIRTDA